MLKLTLHATTYDWVFLPIAGTTFTDSGTGSVHAAPNGDPTFDQNLPNRTDPEGATIDLDAGATDPNGDPLTYAATNLPAGLSIDASTGRITGTISFTANAGSPYAVSVTVRDGATVDATDTFTWTVTNTNQLPTATGATGPTTTNEDTALGLTLRGTDPETCNLTFTVPATTTHGTLGAPSAIACAAGTPNSDTTGVTYTPAANYNGPDSFSYTVTDGSSGTSSPVTVNLTVSPVNDLPVAVAGTASTTTGSPVVISLAGSDRETCELTFATPATTVQGGSLSATSPLTCVAGNPNTDTAGLTYTPPAAYSGPDSFTFTVNDGIVSSAGATISITVGPGGGSTTTTFPAAADAQVYSSKPTTNYGTTSSMRTREGAATSGSPTYRSYVRFTISGLVGPVSDVKLRLWVTDASSDQQQVLAVTPDSWIESGAGSLTYNDVPTTDPPGTPLGSASAPATGAWVEIDLANSAVAGDGSVSFLIRSAGTNSAIFNTREAATNRPELVVTHGSGPGDTLPTATGATGPTTTNEDTALGLTLRGTDPETCNLTFTVPATTTHGTLGAPSAIACAAGTPNSDTTGVTYTPAANYNGPDSFSYTVTDGSSGTSSPVTVNLTVSPVNDLPVAVAGTASTTTGSPVVISLAGSDRETCELTFATPATTVQGGSLSASSPLTCVAGNPNTDTAGLTYTPPAAYSGPDSFTFTVNDGIVSSAGATISITVGPGDTLPTATGATGPTTTNEDTALGLTLRGTDPETCNLTFTVPATTTHGTLGAPSAIACAAGTPNSDTTGVTYTPAANYNGPDSFSYTVTDGSSGTSSPVTVNLTVSPVNDLPVAVAGTASTTTGSPVVISLAGSDRETCELTFATPATTVQGGSLSASSPLTCVAGNPNTDTAGLTYTPPAAYSGPDSFTFTVNDGIVSSAGATISITVGPGGGSTTTTFPAAADAQVYSSKPTTNYGTTSSMRTREGAATSGSPTYRSYVRFTISGLVGPVSDVKLRLWVTDASSDQQQVLAVTPDSWIEFGCRQPDLQRRADHRSAGHPAGQRVRAGHRGVGRDRPGQQRRRRRRLGQLPHPQRRHQQRHLQHPGGRHQPARARGDPWFGSGRHPADRDRGHRPDHHQRGHGPRADPARDRPRDLQPDLHRAGHDDPRHARRAIGHRLRRGHAQQRHDGRDLHPGRQLQRARQLQLHGHRRIERDVQPGDRQPDRQPGQRPARGRRRHGVHHDRQPGRHQPGRQRPRDVRADVRHAGHHGPGRQPQRDQPADLRGGQPQHRHGGPDLHPAGRLQRSRQLHLHGQRRDRQLGRRDHLDHGRSGRREHDHDLPGGGRCAGLFEQAHDQLRDDQLDAHPGGGRHLGQPHLPELRALHHQRPGRPGQRRQAAPVGDRRQQ